MAARNPRFAFLNVPFDREYEPLFLAFIAGLSGFGLIPQSVLQIPGSQRRLDRLTELMSLCRYSFHDISRVKLDETRPRVPRFNMPFELGLAIGLAEGAGEDHLWYAFEAKRHRALKSLSDLNGTEIYIHDGKINGLFRCLMNALARSEHRPTVPDLRAIYRDVGRAAQASRKQLETRHLYESRPFLDLVVVASSSARRHIPSLRESGG